MSGSRKQNTAVGPHSLFAVDLDMAAVLSDDAAADESPQLVVVETLPQSTRTSVEEIRQLPGGHAVAVVRHLEHDVTVALVAEDADEPEVSPLLVGP